MLVQHMHYFNNPFILKYCLLSGCQGAAGESVKRREEGHLSNTLFGELLKEREAPTNHLINASKLWIMGTFMQRAGKSRKILGPGTELAQTSFFRGILSLKARSARLELRRLIGHHFWPHPGITATLFYLIFLFNLYSSFFFT